MLEEILWDKSKIYLTISKKGRTKKVYMIQIQGVELSTRIKRKRLNLNLLILKKLIF